MNFLSAGSGWPAYFSSAGFGSNVSTRLGPPFIIRKMQLVAFAGKCGGRGASGPAGSGRPNANPSAASRWVRASPANPPPISQRVRPQGNNRVMMAAILVGPAVPAVYRAAGTAGPTRGRHSRPYARPAQPALRAAGTAGPTQST